ncbi:hypothetical protein MMC07_003536 [Pseudocyphellaria aurata]|nr:hypothetical protein [Pseudocyphellaria aurata]
MLHFSEAYNPVEDYARKGKFTTELKMDTISTLVHSFNVDSATYSNALGGSSYANFELDISIYYINIFSERPLGKLYLTKRNSDSDLSKAQKKSRFPERLLLDDRYVWRLQTGDDTANG